MNDPGERGASDRRAAVAEILGRALVRLAQRALTNSVRFDLMSSPPQSVHVPLTEETMPNGDAEERDAARGPAAEPGRGEARRRVARWP